MRIINPSILGINKKEEKIKELVNFKLDWIHYDIMDNEFVPNTSLLNEELEKVVKLSPKHIVETHLMVKNPITYYENLPVIPDYASIHFATIKKMDRKEIKEFINQHKLTSFGIAINPEFSLEDIKHIIDLFSFVLVMTVKAGFGGQKFIEDRIQDIKEISDYITINNLPMYIQVDGGVNGENIDTIEASGARNIVVGSFLMKNLNKETINKLKGIKKEAQ